MAEPIRIQPGNNSLEGEHITGRDVTGAISLDVSIVDASGGHITSFGGGTQYTEGDTDTSITGTAAMMEVASDTLQPVQGTVADGLLVNLGSNNDVTIQEPLSVDDNGGSLTIDGSVTADLGANNDVTCTGTVAEGAAYSENPVPVGVEARTTNPTAVDDGDIVSIKADDYGRIIVTPNQCRDLTDTQATVITTTTETTIVTAGGVGVFNDLLLLTLSNTSNNSTEVDIRDDTAGTVLMTIGLAGKGSAVIPFNTPWAQTEANDNWTAELGTAVTSVEIFAQFAKNT